jgi:hypothetical protein
MESAKLPLCSCFMQMISYFLVLFSITIITLSRCTNEHTSPAAANVPNKLKIGTNTWSHWMI